MQTPIKLLLCLFTFCISEFTIKCLIIKTLDHLGSKISQLTHSVCLFRLDMLDSKGDKHNVTLFLSLAIILVVFGQVVGAEIIDHSSSSSTLIISNQNSLRSNGENISGKLSKMRHLLKSLLFDWNSRESEIRGKVRVCLYKKRFLFSFVHKTEISNSKQIKIQFK